MKDTMLNIISFNLMPTISLSMCIYCSVFCYLFGTINGQPFSQILRERAQEYGPARELAKDYLNDHSRKFDPAKDTDATQCSICLADFSIDDTKLVTELSCSSKHIFHLDCLQTWVN